MSWGWGALYFILGGLLTGGVRIETDGMTWLCILGLALPATALSNMTLVQAIKRIGPTLTSIARIARALRDHTAKCMLGFIDHYRHIRGALGELGVGPLRRDEIEVMAQSFVRALEHLFEHYDEKRIHEGLNLPYTTGNLNFENDRMQVSYTNDVGSCQEMVEREVKKLQNPKLSDTINYDYVKDKIDTMLDDFMDEVIEGIVGKDKEER